MEELKTESPELSDREKIVQLDNEINNIIATLNANSEALGMLLGVLGIGIKDTDKGKSVGIVIPNDPSVRPGILPSLLRDITEIKKRLPNEGIVLANSLAGLK